MSGPDRSGEQECAHASEDALRAASQSALLADAAMALLGCRSADDVYEVIADFMLLLAPGAVVIVNDASPDLEWLITRKVAGMNDSLLLKAADLVGFEIIGKRSAVAPAHRGELLGGALSTVPGGFAELASFVIPPSAGAGRRQGVPAARCVLHRDHRWQERAGQHPDLHQGTGCRLADARHRIVCPPLLLGAGEHRQGTRARRERREQQTVAAQHDRGAGAPRDRPR